MSYRVLPSSTLDAASMFYQCRFMAAPPCAAYSHHLPSVSLPRTCFDHPLSAAFQRPTALWNPTRTPKAGARRVVLERRVRFRW